MFSLRMTMFRRPEHHCRVWPWLRLRPSSQGIPASQVYPEQKAKVTCCRRHQKRKTKQSKWIAHLVKKVAAWSRENPWQKTNLQSDAKTKTSPLGNLMIHKIKKRCSIKGFLLFTEVIRSFYYCLSAAVAGSASGRRQTGVKHQKNNVTLEKAFSTV